MAWRIHWRGSVVIAEIEETQVFEDRVNLVGKVIISVIDGNLTVGQADDGIFKVIGGRLSSSVVSHDDGDGGKSDQLLGLATGERKKMP